MHVQSYHAQAAAPRCHGVAGSSGVSLPHLCTLKHEVAIINLLSWYHVFTHPCFAALPLSVDIIQQHRALGRGHHGGGDWADGWDLPRLRTAMGVHYGFTSPAQCIKYMTGSHDQVGACFIVTWELRIRRCCNSQQATVV